MATEREPWEPPTLKVLASLQELTRVTYDPNRDPLLGDSGGNDPERIGFS